MSQILQERETRRRRLLEILNTEEPIWKDETTPS
jgi:hypothetical protein